MWSLMTLKIILFVLTVRLNFDNNIQSIDEIVRLNYVRTSTPLEEIYGGFMHVLNLYQCIYRPFSKTNYSSLIN